MGPVYKLGNPVTHLGTETTELRFPERMQAKHLTGVDLQRIREGDQMMRLVANLTGEHGAVIGELDLGDFMAAAEVVNGFFTPKAGDKSAP